MGGSLALLGVVVPYELAARLAQLFLGTEVCAMTVWRSVQRRQDPRWHFSLVGHDLLPDLPDMLLGVLAVENDKQRLVAEKLVAVLDEVNAPRWQPAWGLDLEYPTP